MLQILRLNMCNYMRAPNIVGRGLTVEECPFKLRVAKTSGCNRSKNTESLERFWNFDPAPLHPHLLQSHPYCNQNISV